MLGVFNVRVDSLTAKRAEDDRLGQLERDDHFDQPILPVLPRFKTCDPVPICEQIRRDEPRFAKIVELSEPGRFPLSNDYYTTPDAEVLYAIVQLHKPNRIIEIGSGYSTQLFRLAIKDAGLTTRLISIDPDPRQEISRYSDEVIRERVEHLKDLTFFRGLDPNDILFVDSSHEIKPGNDLLHIVFDILPVLAQGVLIHFHDIFLPYEYPKEWVIENRWNWTEQYLVQALLTGNDSFEVLWPGYYLQRTRSDFESYFKHWNNSIAHGLWLRKLQSAAAT